MNGRIAAIAAQRYLIHSHVNVGILMIMTFYMETTLAILAIERHKHQRKPTYACAACFLFLKVLPKGIYVQNLTTSVLNENQPYMFSVSSHNVQCDLIPLSFYFVRQQYEVRWHCIRGRGYCYWSQWYGWQSQTVNTTSATLNMTRLGVAYVFEIRVITAQGRGQPYQLYIVTPDFSGALSNFTCEIVRTPERTVLLCHWSHPTGFNPSAFYVSNNW